MKYDFRAELILHGGLIRHSGHILHGGLIRRGGSNFE
jgi:hypothetical protein